MALDQGARRLLDATSGSLGALLVCILMYPVDYAKTQIQSGRSPAPSVMGTLAAVSQAEGVAALFTGMSAKSLHAWIQNFMYFYTYEYLKDSARMLGLRQSTLSNITLGTVAGVTNLTVTLPLETLIVRLQTSEPGSTTALDLAKELANQGLAGTYKGFYISSILTLNPALNFAIFDGLKARVLKAISAATGQRVHSLSAVQAFLLASLAKTLATLLTYPLIRAKVVMQATPLTHKGASFEGSNTCDAKDGSQPPEQIGTHAAPTACAPCALVANPATAASTNQGGAGGRVLRTSGSGILDVLIGIWRTEGLAGLFRGCEAQIFTAVTKAGILLTAKEKLFQYAIVLVMVLGKASNRKALTARMQS